MAKLVVLKLGEGDFDCGFPVTLQIGEDGDRPHTEITGKLPPDPDLPQNYILWQSAYLRLGWRFRLEAKAVQVTNVSITNDCWRALDVLSRSLNHWLHSESFRPIREKWLEKLMPSDEVRVILQTEDILLQRLPWNLCDLFERYPQAEIALSAPVYEQVKQVASAKAKISILAILGDSTGIDTQADRVLLEQLPGTNVTFLVEPQRQQLTDQLWSQGWDILFFAGHSASLANGDGHISINKTDSLTINDLQYALKTAVAHGLKLAIFNSCDGLGLARSLASLYIPQIIVMREPVPDQVAQEFLKNFLQAYAGGESLYLSVREARERLQGLEDEFPCASCLPVIYQNPAEIPLTWQQLSQPVKTDAEKKRLNRDRRYGKHKLSLRSVLLTSLAIATAVVGVRHLGLLQPLELQAFDGLTRLRPSEGKDPRLLVVAVTEQDFQLPEQKQRAGSLSNLALEKLLQKLERYQPRAIGLDIYRDQPVPQYADLAKRLRTSDRFIGICRVSDPNAREDPSIAPPPEVPEARIGFSDVVRDSDGIVRRQLLSANPYPGSACGTPYAFSLQLAFRYLASEGIIPKWTPEGNLQLGKVVLRRIPARMGGYQPVDARGLQILLNYRPYRNPEDVVAKVTLQDVLQDKVMAEDIKNRVVLIGVTAESDGDYFATPYSAGGSSYRKMAGVFVHAQMVSQLLSAVLNQRPLLWVLPQWGEFLWIWGWSIVGSVSAWRCRSILQLELALAVAVGVLSLLCFAAIAYSGWIPLVPSALTLIASSVAVVTYRAWQSHTNLSAGSLGNEI